MKCTKFLHFVIIDYDFLWKNLIEVTIEVVVEFLSKSLTFVNLGNF